SLTEEISNLNVISILQQEKVIVFLNNYFAKSNIDVSGISFTDASVVEMSHIPEQEELKEISSLEKIMNDIKETPQSEVSTEGNESTQGSGDTKQPSMSARRISANITFESSYNDMLNFIDAIQNNPVDISITNISTLTPGGNLLQGNMALNFYEIPDEGYTFLYDTSYLTKDQATPVSLTLPIREQTYVSKNLFPFFDGLIPEGWLLNIVSRNWKVDPADRFGLLLVACKDCVGNVSIRGEKI
ncbi:MAG TPA: HipA N-terminal domain-containing protein, partial [Clostridiales bacterium]|nr:HipA N-terminal domain-containing protein [Clostridiales bacterium]